MNQLGKRLYGFQPGLLLSAILLLFSSPVTALQDSSCDDCKALVSITGPESLSLGKGERSSFSQVILNESAKSITVSFVAPEDCGCSQIISRADQIIIPPNSKETIEWEITGTVSRPVQIPFHVSCSRIAEDWHHDGNMSIEVSVTNPFRLEMEKRLTGDEEVLDALIFTLTVEDGSNFRPENIDLAIQGDFLEKESFFEDGALFWMVTPKPPYSFEFWSGPIFLQASIERNDVAIASVDLEKPLYSILGESSELVTEWLVPFESGLHSDLTRNNYKLSWAGSTPFNLNVVENSQGIKTVRFYSFGKPASSSIGCLQIASADDSGTPQILSIPIELRFEP